MTGCDHDGTEKIQTTGSLTQYRGLGNPFVRIGRLSSSVTGHGPLSGGANDEDDDNRPMYGISAVFTIVDQLPPITLVSNTGQTQANVSSAIQSQPFTTGSNLGGYTLTSVDVGIEGDNIRTRLFHIVPNKGNDEPNLSDPTKFITLTTPASTAADKIHTFTAPADAKLAANTTYHLYLANEDGGNPGNIHRVSSQDEDDGGAPGWSIGNKRYRKNSSSDPWITDASTIVRMQINGLNALPSTDATLSALAIEGATSGDTVDLSTTFAAGTFTYTATVGNRIDEVTLTAIKNHSGATIAITDDDDANTKETADLDLDVGANALTVTVTAEDANTTETYTITVTRDFDPTDPVTVPETWSLIPTALGAGDQFRLIFGTSGTRDATATAIGTYNTFVQDAAAAGHADIQPYSDGFWVVGSTADTDARDNTGTTYTSTDKGVPIYWLGGTKVADDYEDFYDGSWDDEVNTLDESGSARNLLQGSNNPFTGSGDDGTEFIFGGFSFPLGTGTTAIGIPGSADPYFAPLYAATKSNTEERPFYGLSAVFIVPATVPDAPTNLSATPDGSGQIDLEWNPPAQDGGQGISGYKIQSSPNGTSNWTDLVSNTGTGETEYSDTGLDPSIRPIWHCQLVREPRQDAILGIDEGLWDVRWSWCRRSTESGWQHRKRDGSGR